MKKKLICLLLCFMLLPVSLVHGLVDPELPRVVDEAGLLTQSQTDDLTAKIASITDQYQMDVVILTVDSLGYRSAQDYADDYYDEHGYGVGSDYSGILLLISMEERDWWISTCGEAIYAITDYGIEQLFSEMSYYLSQNRFYEAFDAYLQSLPQYFQAYENGQPIDGYAGSYDGPGSNAPGDAENVVHYEGSAVSPSGRFLISVIIGLITALIAVLAMRRNMNTKRGQYSAGAYVIQESFHLRKQQDMFLYSSVSKTPRPKDTTRSGGGSSTHRSSSGRSHGGGGGKF